MRINGILRFCFGTLRGRLILSVAAVHAAMMLLFIVDLTIRQRSEIRESQETDARAVSLLLSTSASIWLAADDVAGLQELVDVLGRQQEVEFAILASKEGRILAHTDHSRIGQYLLDLPADPCQTVLAATPALVDVTTPSMLGGKPVGWARVGIGQQTASQRLSSTILHGVFYALVAIAIGSVIAWLMGNGVTRRLHAIMGTIAATKAGNACARSSIPGSDEAAVLACEFNAMLDSLSRRDASLRESETRFRTIFEEAPVALWEEDFSAVKARIDALRQAGVTDFRAYFDQHPDMVVDLAQLVRVLDGNQRSLELFAIPDGTRLCRDLSRYFTPDSFQVFKEELIVLAHGGSRFQAEAALLNSKGEPLVIDLTLVVQPGCEGTLSRVLVSFVDITARKQAETELRAREEDLAITLRSIGDAVIATDAMGRITRLNLAAEALTGWTHADAIGQPLPAVFNLVRSGCQEAGPNPVDAVLRRGETAELAKDGVLIARDGQERRITDLAAPIRDDHGAIRGAVLVCRDITDKHQLEERLLQSRKQEVIGQLAGGIAHDFNNMLSVIIGAAELIGLNCAGQQSISHPLRMLTESANRAADLTAKLLNFARIGKVRNVPVDIHHEIGMVVSILQRTIDRQVTIVCDLAAAHSQVRGDPAQIQNVLLNLSINARDAMPHGGCLTFATRDVPGESPELPPLGLPAVQHLALTVSDTGVGIPAWVMARLFEPFVTTKERGKGTGLGLASINGTVRDHGGAITVDSQPGKGATFRILLQCSAPTLEAVATEPVPLQASLHGQTVLVADDENQVREMLVAQLEGFGATVVAAVDGQQAVELFRADPGRYTLVILDQSMPRLNGSEAFRVIHELRPSTRVLIASGFVGGQILDAEMSGLAGFLPKPYSRAELLRLALGTDQTAGSP